VGYEFSETHKRKKKRRFSQNNPGYWCDPHRYEYVRQWREKKKQKKRSSTEIQAQIVL
jgi:hypothetical protein